MAKKRGRYHAGTNRSDGPSAAEPPPDANSREYFFDEVDEFARTKEEKLLIDRPRASRRKLGDFLDKGTPQEVFSVLPSSDEEDDDEEVQEDEDNDDDDTMRSDIEDDDDDYLPSADAWGKKRKTYYNTDYVDKDYGGFSGSEDEQAAELEEQEAKSLQQRLAEQIDEMDFELDRCGEQVACVPDEPSTAATSRGKRKASGTREKLVMSVDRRELFDKLHPEYERLMDELAQTEKQRDRLLPLVRAVKEKRISTSTNLALTLLQKLFEAYSNYQLNLHFYLMLMFHRQSTKGHPVFSRLIQWKKVIAKLERRTTRFDAELDVLLERVGGSGDDIAECIARDELNAGTLAQKPTEVVFDDDSDDEDIVEVDDAGLDADGKRAITYEMAKNKGLQRKRRKRMNNPRVKHKLKFRKALIRRRSQVPDVKRETERYGGEARGIKIGVIRSVKLH